MFKRNQAKTIAVTMSFLLGSGLVLAQPSQ